MKIVPGGNQGRSDWKKRLAGSGVDFLKKPYWIASLVMYYFCLTLFWFLKILALAKFEVLILYLLSEIALFAIAVGSGTVLLLEPKIESEQDAVQ
jgi:hypothetical protein